jgi:TonB family protein
VFSSDQEASRALSQVLRAAGLDVEHCSEIFAAVEKLTTKSFDLIVADMDDGAETTFLLKTAGELNSSKQALTIALAGTGINATQSGVRVVLNKPITADKARWTLLRSDAFLSSMKVWFPDRKSEATTALKGLDPMGSTQAAPAATKKPDLPSMVPLAETASSGFQRTTSAIPLPVSGEGRRRVEQHSWKHTRVKRSVKNHDRRFATVRQLVLGSILLLLAYVVVQPARSEALVTSVVVMYQETVQSADDWLHAPTQDPELAARIRAAEQAPTRSKHVARIRVTPVVSGDRETTIPPPPEMEQPESETRSDAVEQARASQRPRIPESLKASYESSAVHNTAEKTETLGSSLLNAMEPVVLSEDLSQKLLLDKVQPSYPEQAIKAGLQGPVVLQAWISRQGTIQDLKLVRGYFILGQAASQAVRQWRYKPYLLNGQAVEAQTYVTVDFKLP